MNTESILFAALVGVAVYMYATRNQQGIALASVGAGTPLQIPSCPAGQYAGRTALGVGPYACMPIGEIS